MSFFQVLQLLLGHFPALAPIAVYCCVVCTAASLIDSIVPQPNPGSNWTPLRRVVGLLALNIKSASNAGRPPMRAWLLRMLQLALAATPAGTTAATVGLGAAQILSLVEQAEKSAPPAPPPVE